MTENVKYLLDSFIQPSTRKAKLPSSNLRQGAEFDSHTLEAFKQRLKTFDSSKWFAKPTWLTPPLCARYGWVCCSEDTLQCSTCKVYLSCHLPKSSEPTIHEDCCKRIEDGLHNNHVVSCIWRTTPASEEFLHPRSGCKEELLSTVSAAVQFQDMLPSISRENLKKLELTSDLICQVKKWSELQDENSEYVTVALAMAVCGWQICKERSQTFAKCSYCHRKLGFWNYYTIEECRDGVPRAMSSAKLPRTESEVDTSCIMEKPVEMVCPETETDNFSTLEKHIEAGNLEGSLVENISPPDQSLVAEGLDLMEDEEEKSERSQTPAVSSPEAVSGSSSLGERDHAADLQSPSNLDQLQQTDQASITDGNSTPPQESGADITTNEGKEMSPVDDSASESTHDHLTDSENEEKTNIVTDFEGGTEQNDSFCMQTESNKSDDNSEEIQATESGEASQIEDKQDQLENQDQPGNQFEDNKDETESQTVDNKHQQESQNEDNKLQSQNEDNKDESQTGDKDQLDSNIEVNEDPPEIQIQDNKIQVESEMQLENKDEDQPENKDEDQPENKAEDQPDNLHDINNVTAADQIEFQSNAGITDEEETSATMSVQCESEVVKNQSENIEELEKDKRRSSGSEVPNLSPLCSARLSTSPRKRRSYTQKSQLNPVEEHRSWCIWYSHSNAVKVLNESLRSVEKQASPHIMESPRASVTRLKMLMDEWMAKRVQPLSEPLLFENV